MYYTSIGKLQSIIFMIFISMKTIVLKSQIYLIVYIFMIEKSNL